MKKKTQDDLRFRKTERLIQQTFRELLKEKDYCHISIQELASRAEINRNTFYLHYPSMDALLLKMQTDIIDHFLEPIKDARLPDDLEKVVRNCYKSSLSFDVLDEKILNSKGHFPIDTSDTNNYAVLKFDEKYLNYDANSHPILLAYINGCLTEIYKFWIKNGQKESMEDMIQITLKLLTKGLLG